MSDQMKARGKRIGRPYGVPNTATKALRDLMERITPGNEPVPVILLRMGFKYHQDGDHANALTAIKGACDFAYPKLKAIEHSGGIAMNPTLEIILPGINDSEPITPTVETNPDAPEPAPDAG